MSIKKSMRILLTISSIIPVIIISIIGHRLLTHRLITAQTYNLQQVAETNITGLEALILKHGTSDISHFQEYLNSIQISDTGYGVLFDKEGTILYHPNISLVGTKIPYDLDTKLPLRNTNTTMIYDVPYSGAFQHTFKDTKYVSGYSILPELDWVLLINQDIKEISSLTDIMLFLLILICIILVSIIMFFAQHLSKKYTEPIIALRDAMRTAAEGNLHVQCNINSKNELGELSKNFNKMLHIIKTNYDDLSSMHKQLLSNEEQLRLNYDQIEYLAYHDVLTNLPNKLSFLDYVSSTLSSPDTCMHGIYFIDLDNFKTINDTLGHEYGDMLLVKTASILTDLVGDRGMLARAGGDEFMIFLDHIASKEEASYFASNILHTFKTPVELKDELVYVYMSIGISIYPENGLSTNILVKNADIAMYKSKDSGKNKITLFDCKMEEELNRNTLILDVLRNAIDRNEVYIQYQPLIDANMNTTIGFEALMRIRSEELGFLSPTEFIPIAEESGLIIELSSWLLREACYFNRNLIDQGISPRFVAVNISSVQMKDPGFVRLISDILEETQLPPQYLELEITESTLVSSLMDASLILSKLKEIGVRVSLDDFGTGYSSLNYLTKMPINTLKIDKSFIDNICANIKDSYIAESIIQLAHSLNMTVVAEGVESQQQFNLLRDKKCDIIQGYLFSTPLHPPALVDYICKI